MKKIQKRDGSLSVQYEDKKGHVLFRVYMRDYLIARTLRIPYFYCKKCDKFSKIKVDNKIAVIKIG